MQYLSTIKTQVKHEVAGVRYVRGDNSSFCPIHIEMETSVGGQYCEPNTCSDMEVGLVQHWPLDTVVLQDRLV